MDIRGLLYRHTLIRSGQLWQDVDIFQTLQCSSDQLATIANPASYDHRSAVYIAIVTQTVVWGRCDHLYFCDIDPCTCFRMESPYNPSYSSYPIARNSADHDPRILLRYSY